MRCKGERAGMLRAGRRLLPWLQRHAMARVAGVFARHASLTRVCVLVRVIRHAADFKKFQRGFLLVYLIMMSADWLQGPYVVALYQHYGFSLGDIGHLFIVGFGSSMVFGTFVGGLADRFGRRANCIAFGVLYAASCVTKHFNNYSLLMVGRLLGGIATSILYSAFETWMVHEHKSNGFPEDWLSNTFSVMTFGNGAVAIVAGLLASVATDIGGPVAPFDLSFILLVLGTIIVAKGWPENYGESTGAASFGFENFRQAWTVVTSNERVLLLGVIQSCFEAAMYIFVFMWTPAMKAYDADIPHGIIFASFMVCLMIGSNLFRGLQGDASIESFLRVVFLVAACCLAIPVFLPGARTNLVAFCVFEAACGIYFPGMGTLRGKYVPEEVRATIMNIFRIGLNLIVVLALSNIDRMSSESIFSLCVALLALATMAQHRLFTLSNTNATAEERTAAGLEVGEEVDELLSTKQDVAA